MPAIAALSINDGQATPAAHTFAVQGTTGLRATWLEKTAGVASGYLKLTDEYREAKSATGANSRILGFEFPVVATVDGSTVRVRVSSAQVRFNFAQDSTDQERKDAVAYVTNVLSNSTMKAAIWGQEPTY